MNLINKKGVDVSYSQGNVNMKAIKDFGAKFVMIKCGNGSDIKSQDDPQFEANVKKAEALGLPWGVYIYSYAVSVLEAKSEVEHVKRLLKGKKPTMPIAFDMEDADGYKTKRGALHKDLITKICETFLSGIEKAGYYPILYCSRSWLDNYISKSVYSKYDLWVAQWATKCGYSGGNLGMWQYGGEVNYLESNNIKGVGTIDKDICYKNYPAIIKKGGYNNFEKKKAKEKPTLDSTGLKLGDKNDDVLKLKKKLIKAKEKGLISAGMKKDRKFGAGTKKAVNQLLKKWGYKTNGIAGEKFIKKLNKELK